MPNSTEQVEGLLSSAVLHALPRLTAALVHADPQPADGTDYHAALATLR